MISNLGWFCDSQAFSSTGAVSDRWVDFNSVRQQIGVGVPIYLCIRTTVAQTGTNPTIIISVQMADDSDFSGTDLVNLFCICDTEGAALPMDTDYLERFETVGAWIWRAPLPYELSKGFMRLNVLLAGTTPTISLDAWLDLLPLSDKGAKAQVWASPVGNPDVVATS